MAQVVSYEEGLIGCILKDNGNNIGDIYNMVKPEMFQNKLSRHVFETILGLYDRGKDITVVTVVEMAKNDTIDNAFLGKFVIGCLENCELSTDIKHFAQSIVSEYRRTIFKKLFQDAKLNPSAIDTTIAQTILSLESLMENKENPTASMSDIVDAVSGDYFCDREVKGVETGFYKLDEALYKLEPGDVCVVGARPSVGKSAFVVNVARHNTTKYKRVGYFNLEMSQKQNYERFFVNFSNSIELQRLKRAKAATTEEAKERDRVNKLLKTLPLYMSSGSKTVGEIRSEARHMNYDLIIIDYLQLIKAEKNYGNRASEVGDISKSIKAMAMELKVPVIILSQLNRVSEINADKEPTMSELRESGDIEQDASIIILMWNISSDDRRYKGIKIDKNRQGELIREALRFDGRHMRFFEESRSIETLKSQIAQEQKTKQDLRHYEEENNRDDYMDTSQAGCPFAV